MLSETTEHTKYKHKILIVGAGISGLTSAIHLIDGGIDPSDIVIIEAQDRVGGRIHGMKGPDGTGWDFGGQWHHPDDNGNNSYLSWIMQRYPNHATIINENPLPCSVITSAGIIKIPHDDREVDALLFGELEKLLEENKHNPDYDPCFPEVLTSFLLRNPDEKFHTHEFLVRATAHVARTAEYFMGAKHSSGREILLDPCRDGGKQVWEGQGAHIDAMAQDLRTQGVQILTNTRLSKLSRSGKAYSITSTQGSSHVADGVILTPSPHTLARMAENGVFDFDTSALKNYADTIEQTYLTKILIPFSEGSDLAAIAHDTFILNLDARLGLSEAIINPGGKKGIVLLAIGHTAKLWERLYRNGDFKELENIVRHIQSQTPIIQGLEKFDFSKMKVTEWNHHPDFMGVYGAMKVGHKRSGPMSLAPRVIACGDGFDARAGGTMLSAFESAKIAAPIMLQALQRNTAPLTKSSEPTRIDLASTVIELRM